MGRGDPVSLDDAGEGPEGERLGRLASQRCAGLLLQLLETLGRRAGVGRRVPTQILLVDPVVTVPAPGVEHVDALTGGRRDQPCRTREAPRALADHLAAAVDDRVHALSRGGQADAEVLEDQA